MTTEEKLQHFYDISMESAREESQKALSEYQAVLAGMLEEHKKDKQEHADMRLKLEAENARREINKALSAEQLHIKRRLSARKQDLCEKLFMEVRDQLEAFMSTNDYLLWLEKKAKEAIEIAGEDEVQIYITAADTSLRENLSARCHSAVLISETPFMGGLRAVIPSKNILIDNTFDSSFDNVKEAFNIDGGLIHE